MGSLLLVVGTFVGYLLAYHTYGKWLGAKVFRLSDERPTAAQVLADDKDYCPTSKEVLFGHHYTSIAGTGPIVGPAVAVIWGWLPAVLWVFFGAILMGGIHDLGALVISARNEGKSIGDLSHGIINRRVQILFMLIICLVLFVLIAVFALVVAVLFQLYPQAVLPVWSEIPIAIIIGWIVYKKSGKLLLPSLIALVLMYLMVVVGAYYPFSLPEQGFLGRGPIFDWVIVLLAYSFVASVLPVWLLLQPRDYINSHQLFVAMALLLMGILVAQPPIIAPAVNLSPQGAPPFWPFLFITIACGAVSGFHCLVGSGTTSKQLKRESEARFIGYGAMLTESFLAILVIIACVAGISLGFKGASGTAAWTVHYGAWDSAAGGLAAKLAAFVEGSANLLHSLGIPHVVAITVMGVLLASFAGTSLDTSTRLQRYIIGELAQQARLNKLANPYIATLLAVIPAGILALHDGVGKGGMTLWPIFGTLNQLVAGLALLVITVYLARKSGNFWVTLIPMLFMMIATGFAMYYNLSLWIDKAKQVNSSLQWTILAIVGTLIAFFEIWIVIESCAVLLKLRQKQDAQREMALA